MRERERKSGRWIEKIWMRESEREKERGGGERLDRLIIKGSNEIKERTWKE